jgi:hypothetical protein
MLGMIAVWAIGSLCPVRLAGPHEMIVAGGVFLGKKKHIYIYFIFFGPFSFSFIPFPLTSLVRSLSVSRPPERCELNGETMGERKFGWSVVVVGG